MPDETNQVKEISVMLDGTIGPKWLVLVVINNKVKMELFNSLDEVNNYTNTVKGCEIKVFRV
jgi:hypothetical protein